MRELAVVAIKTDAHDGKPIMLVCMDLETYNDALENFINKLADENFNNGFEAANNPSEEEIADMDADDSKKE